MMFTAFLHGFNNFFSSLQSHLRDNNFRKDPLLKEIYHNIKATPYNN